MLPNKDSKPIFDHSFTNTTMGKFKTKGFRDQNCHKSEESDDEAASTISNGSSSSSSSSICSSSSSFDTTDDASSSSSSRSSLYDLSDLMSQLPIKRGLSKFYHGKSDSFTSLARVTSIEDLPKKEKRIKKMKAINYKSHILPKPIISKKKLSSSIFKSST